MWKIIALTKPFKGQEFIIDSDTLLGRHQQSNIVLPSQQISRRHAILRLYDGQLWLEDLNSALGSYVNGQRVTKQQLVDEDEISFDHLRFQVLATSIADADIVGQLPSQNALVDHLAIDQGMPTLAERDATVLIQADGMPRSISIPKPAPIPDTVKLDAPQRCDPVKIKVDSRQTPDAQIEQQKNIKLGLLVVLLLVLVVALVLYVF